MKNYYLLFGILLLANVNIAQVGIGTITPDASSQLDIAATDKGMLAPRVSLNDVTNTMIDGVNTAATGLLIYNNNAATVGGSGEGFYYFNGTIWIRLVTSDTNFEDADWYEEGTTNSPNDINDDIFTQGNVAIGNTTADYALDIYEVTEDRGINLVIAGADDTNKIAQFIENSNTGNGVHIGSLNKLSGSGNGNQSGILQQITNNGTGSHFGTANYLLGTGTGIQYGSYQIVNNSGAAKHYGTYNGIGGSGIGEQYGSWNVIQNTSNGIHYGTYNNLKNRGDGTHYGTFNHLLDDNGIGNGDHYGSYNLLEGTGTGTSYGVYSQTLKAGSYAGYFLGSVAVGTTTANNYIFPATRGSANQMMQTDGSGNVSWSTLDNVDEMTVNNLFVAPKLAAAPAAPTAGQIYYDTGSNKLRCYNGSVWNDLW